MQFSIVALALASIAVVNGAKIQARGGHYGGYGHHGYKAPAVPVCPADHTALCCELDVLGVIDATCIGAGNPTSAAKFEATCAKKGRTAECCTIAAGGIGLICEEQ